jgi:hypothetical protein
MCHGDNVQARSRRKRRRKEGGSSSWADSQVGKIVGLNAIFPNVFILIGSVLKVVPRTCFFAARATARGNRNGYH